LLGSLLGPKNDARGSEHGPNRQESLISARDICWETFSDESDDAELFHLWGAFCAIIKNSAFALYCFRKSMILAPDSENYRKIYERYLSDGAAEETGDAVEHADLPGHFNSQGLADIIRAFHGRYSGALKGGDVRRSERWLNTLLPFYEPFFSPFLSVAECGRITGDHERAGVDSDLADSFQDGLRENWFSACQDESYGLDDPNRKEFAKLVGDCARTPGRDETTCLEIGCHTGAATREVANVLPAGCKITALDPNRAALAELSKGLPEVTTLAGTVEDALAQKIPLPEKIAVVFAFSVFCQIPSSSMAAFFARISQRTRAMVLCDQIFNCWGEESILRFTRTGLACFYLHPYGRILKELGFSDISLLPLPLPQRAVDGIIVAKK